MLSRDAGFGVATSFGPCEPTGILYFPKLSQFHNEARGTQLRSVIEPPRDQGLV